MVRDLGGDERLIAGGNSAEAMSALLAVPDPPTAVFVANDRMACARKPLDRADYGLVGMAFTADQWATLEQVFADGVCDWSKPGLGQGPAETWLEYGDEAGPAVYGGRPLPAPPAGSGTGWADGSFAELLEQ